MMNARTAVSDHPGGMDDDTLAAAVATLAAHIHAATWRLLVLIAELDRRKLWAAQGAMSCAHWLSWAYGIDAHNRPREGPGRARIGRPAAPFRSCCPRANSVTPRSARSPASRPPTTKRTCSRSACTAPRRMWRSSPACIARRAARTRRNVPMPGIASAGSPSGRRTTARWSCTGGFRRRWPRAS